MLILLNIGNTHTQVGSVDQLGNIVKIKSVPTCNFSASMLPPNCDIAAATVVPEIKNVLAERKVFWIKEADNFNVNFDLVDFNAVGSDRIANAATLAATGSLPGLCIDCGTAITFELVDQNALFQGGGIAPGRRLMSQTLRDHTAQLPLVELTDNILTEVGHNTSEAITVGIETQLIGGIREFIRLAHRQLDCSIKVIVVGGDSQIILDNIDGLEYGGDDFTLRGIMTLWELNNR
jgi:type III pantothenate kinase